MTATVTQCKSCPWRVDCEPERDIPNGYSVQLHESLRDTIATSPLSSLLPMMSGACVRMMACHYSEKGAEHVCAGWLYNQIGSGNNIAVRLLISRGQLPVPTVIGDQHDDFDDTLPASARARAVREPDAVSRSGDVLDQMLASLARRRASVRGYVAPRLAWTSVLASMALTCEYHATRDRIAFHYESDRFE